MRWRANPLIFCGVLEAPDVAHTQFTAEKIQFKVGG